MNKAIFVFCCITISAALQAQLPIQIERTSDDRILMIVGMDHLNLLNLFFDTSREFEFVSPLPYLERAKKL